MEEIENTGLDCKDVRDGNSCHYKCETGYQLMNGTKSMSCSAWGKWEGMVPHCQSKYLLPLQILPFTSVLIFFNSDLFNEFRCILSFGPDQKV